MNLSAQSIVAAIPEIIFGLLLFLAICAFWINWFSDEKKSDMDSDN